MSSIKFVAIGSLLLFAVVLVVYQVQQVGQDHVSAASPGTFRLVLITGVCATLLAIGPLWTLVA